MNKNELINAMAVKSGLNKKDVTSALTAFTEVITETLKAGDEVALTGFGAFHVTSREAREGRNPQTGDVITIPARNCPAFKAGKVLKDAVN